MLGLTALEAKLAGLTALLTLALIILVGFGWHERSVGAGKCEAADAKAAQIEDKKDAQTLQKDEDAVKTEGITYETIIAAPPPVGPPVRLCHDTPHPPSVPAAPVARPKADAPPAVPATAGGDPEKGPDLGPELRANTRQADAQVAGLQAYIRTVCLAQH